MSKIFYDETSLKALVNEKLDNANKYLKAAINLCNQLSTPYDFKYKSYVDNIENNINSELEVLENIVSILKKSSNKYSNINDNLNTSVSNLNNYSILLRETKIK